MSNLFEYIHAIESILDMIEGSAGHYESRLSELAEMLSHKAGRERLCSMPYDDTSRLQSLAKASPDQLAHSSAVPLKDPELRAVEQTSSGFLDSS